MHEKKASPEQVELTRQVVREFVTSSEELLKDWFREFLREDLAMQDQVGRILKEVRERYETASGMPQLMREHITALLEAQLREDKALARKGLDQIVRECVAREVMATYSRDRVAWGDWTRAFSFDSARIRNGPLKPVAGHVKADVPVEEELLPHALEECIARDPHPLPSTEDREGYGGEHHYHYWLSGLHDRGRIVATLREHGVELEPGSAILDMGAASGRVLRHFLCQDEGLDLWGTDINRNHVDWVNRYLPGQVRAFQCTILPLLPLPDSSLRLVYALSVFTHIDEFELAWLAELRRVLEPGGIAYLTIHSEDTWAGMDPSWAVHQHLLAARDHIHEYDVTAKLFQSPMPEDKVVFRWRSATMNNTNVFASKDYVRRTWGRFLDVLDIVHRGSGYQDVVVLQKPRGQS